MKFTSLLFTFSLVCFIQVSAQLNTYIKGINPKNTIEQQPLMVSVGLQSSSELSRVELFYRQFGQTDFRSLEMQLLRDSAVTEISAHEILPPFIEVYIVATTHNGTSETFPMENPQINPARINIDLKPKYESEIIILSPEEGENIKEGETYISLSFVYADTIVDKSKTTIQLNGVDLSDKIVFFDDLLIVPPEAIPSTAMTGGANLSVQTFTADGTPYATLQRGFTVLTTQQAEEVESAFQGYGNAQAESRNENIKGSKKTYNRLDARAFGTYAKFLRANAQLTLSSEEKPENQPQNRYYLGLDARYAKLGLGDAYPRFPYTIMDGRRLRGFTFDLLLGAFNVNIANGELTRGVEINSTQQTLQRKMTVVRPSFGKGEKFQWGFTYLKAKDTFDSSKIMPVNPQENVVFGTDFFVALDDRRIEFTAQSAFSLNNLDISTGPFNRDSIDSAIVRDPSKKSDLENLKRFLPYLEKIITVNGSFEPQNPIGGTSVVYETALSFNYFGNYLKASYLFHGKHYSSAGASSLRKDIKGFNITDRIRLLENRLFVTGSYEQLQNNTARNEITTTTYNAINASVSYYPSSSLPNITVGYGLNKNSNPLPSDTTNKSSVEKQTALRALDDKTNRYFLQTSYDFIYWGRHNAAFNLDVSDKTDNTIKQQGISTFNTSILVSTVHGPRLESTVGFGISSLKFPQFNPVSQITEQSSLAYQTLSLSGRYKIIEDILRLNATFAPTFGDFARTMLESSLAYSITEHQSAVLQFQFIANSSTALSSTVTSKNDSYVSLMYRIDF
ncbi:MAG: hypothetical protein Q8L88_07185 [Bacteroidota bacterium]|nr:hypothetical protein [Bacteroidota bacterium]